MRRTLSILIENKPGALARVVGLFHQRGYNIESLNVAPIFDGSYSRMTVSTRGTENVVEQITKQINKIIDVIKVSDLTEGEHHEIEMILIKMQASKFTKKLRDKLNSQQLNVIEESKDIVVLSIIDASSSYEAIIKSIGISNILEVVRSGSLGIHESTKTLKL